MRGVCDTYFSLFNSSSGDLKLHLYHDMSHRVLPSNMQGTAPSLGIGPMGLQEQQALLVVAALRQDHKERKERKKRTTQTLETQQTTPSQSSFNVSQIVSRLYASQLPGQKIKADRLKCILNKELAEGARSVASIIIDHLFASTKLPFKVDDDLLEKLRWKTNEQGVRTPGVWTGEKFREPPKHFTEVEFSGWMNELAQAMSSATGSPVRRLWSHHTCNTPPVGALVPCKPDLVLLDTTYLARIQDLNIATDWALIRAFAEVTSEMKTPQRMHDTVKNKSFLTFNCQPARRLAISLSFNGAGEMALTLADREGLLRMPETLLLPDGGPDVSLMLLRMLGILMFGTDIDIGLDPHCEVDDFTGKVKAITVDKTRFEIEKEVYSLDSLVGRGTQVWVVKRSTDQRRFIMKDAWTQRNRIDSEHKFLTKIRSSDLPDSIKNSLPMIMCGGDVTINGVCDDNSYYRSRLGGSRTHRIHQRFVCEPIGEPLTAFRTKKEFISAIIDVIHGGLCCFKQGHS